MNNLKLGERFLKELEMEAPATRKCLERMKAELFDWKPHEKSMQMGYLALLCADMPRWITRALQDGIIDFATYENKQAKTPEELLALFDANIEDAKKVLREASDESFDRTFELRRSEQLLFSAPMADNIESTLNHWVHHRGQFSVYMRLNGLPVPSIYGPSADEPTF